MYGIKEGKEVVEKEDVDVVEEKGLLDNDVVLSLWMWCGLRGMFVCECVLTRNFLHCMSECVCMFVQ